MNGPPYGQGLDLRGWGMNPIREFKKLPVSSDYMDDLLCKSNETAKPDKTK
jgi:hypothetical protein